MKPDTLTRAGWPGLALSRFVLRAVYSAFFITLFFSPSVAAAQEAGCGEIDYGYFSQPVEDCSNPFGRTHVETGFLINGQPVIDGSTIVVPEAGVTSYGLHGENFFNPGLGSYYKHTETGYLALGVEFAYPERTEIEAKIAEYFNNDQNNILTYTQIYDASYKYPFFNLNSEQRYFDANLGRYVEDVYYEMEEYIEANSRSGRTPLLPGTYTYTRVDTDEVISVSQAKSPLKQLREFLVPTAHAYYNVHTVTFTLATSTPVVVSGAPSVLFLPGIMGSRLFEESGECNLFGGVDKVERWVSTFDCDTERLLMDENGQSVYPLFTEAEGGVVEDVAVASNLYDSFFEDLADWKEEGKIADYRGVPYDWRLRLDDILKTVNVGGRISLDSGVTYQDGYVYRSLAAMVAASPSEKVVLVGHSNGGLVIKTLLATMKANNDPLLDSIEKVVLVAVPQAGTPESVVGMLHGVDIGIAGVAVSEEQSRKLINTAPFGYHLLPSVEYFDMVDTPVIAIEGGTSTSAWQGQFGAEIDTLIELRYFLEKGSGRTTPEWSDLLTPATAHSHLIGYANNVHGFMEDWKPAEASVYEVAGTGIETPATIKYFSDFTCLRTEIGTGGVTRCVEPGTKLGYRVDKVIDGDGTVVTPSALALPLLGGSDKWFVDLESYSKSSLITRKHKNIFEVQEVIDLVSDVVSSSTLDGYNFISKTEPSFEGKSRLVYQLHSPLDLYVILHDGEVVGSSTPSLRGVEYSRYGELQQLSIPEGESDYEIRLNGLATGSFTLDIDSYDGDVLADRQTYSAVPSSTSTRVSLKVEEDEEVVLEIDYQGDGIFEATVLPGLAVIVPVAVVPATPVVPETKSKSSSTKVKDRSLPSAPLGELSSGQVVASTQHELMLKLITLLTQYRDLLIKIKVQ